MTSCWFHLPLFKWTIKTSRIVSVNKRTFGFLSWLKLSSCVIYLFWCKVYSFCLAVAPATFVLCRYRNSEVRKTETTQRLYSNPRKKSKATKYELLPVYWGWSRGCILSSSRVSSPQLTHSHSQQVAGPGWPVHSGQKELFLGHPLNFEKNRTFNCTIVILAS